MTELLKTGKCEFYVTGFMAKDKDGNDLTMKNGGKYKKLKLMVTDSTGNSATLYDPIFGPAPEKVEQLVNSLGIPLFERAFQTGKLELKELVGSGGHCIIGVKEREGYDPQNTVECYLRNQSYGVIHTPALVRSPQQADPFEPELEDDAPF